MTFNADIKSLSRVIKIGATISIVCFIILIAAIVFYRPVKNDDSKINEALERQREAIVTYRQSLEELKQQAIDNIRYLNNRDSILNESLATNNNELKKINDRKQTIDRTYFNSEQLQRAVADAARLYRSGQ